MASKSEPLPKRPLSPLSISLIFAAISVAYIFISQIALHTRAGDVQQLTPARLIAGGAYVISAALLLYWLVKRSIQAAVWMHRARDQADHRYRRMIETTNEGVWVVNERGETEYVNQTMAQMLGYEADEMIGRNRVEFLPQHLASAEGWMKSSRRHPSRGEIELRRRNGSMLHAIISITPINDRAGRFGGWLQMITDITELNRSQQELESHVHALRALHNELDHRVRNTLTSILGLIEISRSSDSDVGSFASELGGRVQALAKAHALMGRALRGQLRLIQVVEALLPPYIRAHTEIEGPEVLVGPAQLGPLALLLHELLSTSRSGKAPDGRMKIHWNVTHQEHGSSVVNMTLKQPAGRILEENDTSWGLLEGLVRSDLRGKCAFRVRNGRIDHRITMVLDLPQVGPPPG